VTAPVLLGLAVGVLLGLLGGGGSILAVPALVYGHRLRWLRRPRRPCSCSGPDHHRRGLAAGTGYRGAPSLSKP
jgi:hypothetical protein